MLMSGGVHFVYFLTVQSLNLFLAGHMYKPL